MTSRTVRNGEGHQFPGGFKKLIISCDQMSCDQMSCDKELNDTEIREGGGLAAMGWTHVFVGDKTRHYCPEHKRT